ncbi:MAG: Gfo/Idh/MocA family oxidoreductase [Fuerstiella sp.]|nr:Gfo/Idh/MocA family oxidoreductase [Fuerstiella sp.]
MVSSETTRRSFLKTGSKVAAAATTLQAASVGAYAGEDSEIRIALIGCGGRGTGAASQAMSVADQGPVRLVAMADVFDRRLETSRGGLAQRFEADGKMDVPEDRQFIGFDAYKKAMDCLRPGDLVILATPPAFRWVHYTYAIEKGLNVFMEKPVSVDGPTSRRMLELNKLAVAKNLKVAVGLMCRHCDARRELFDRIQNGEIGEINLLRANRLAGPTASAAVPPMPKGISPLHYQISQFHGFLWLSGGAVSDFLIHNIDEGCWMKDAWPVEAVATGGRHYRGDMIDQNFDSYSIEYTFADGTKMLVGGRTVPGCYHDFATYAHGTKGLAIVSSSGHRPAKSRIYKGHNAEADSLQWAYPRREENPYQLEWNDLIAAIRKDAQYNEVERGTLASLTASLGRMAAHTGQKITFDQILNGDHEFAPDVDKLTLTGDSPLMPNDQGKYPIPYPGIITDREYA